MKAIRPRLISNRCGQFVIEDASYYRPVCIYLFPHTTKGKDQEYYNLIIILLYQLSEEILITFRYIYN